jgi:TM2 domain
MYSKAIAFVLGIISFLPPFSGLLRFYLKRNGTGVLYTLTAGLCFIGNILDIVQIPQLVKHANMRLKSREMRRLDDLDEDFDRVREIEYKEAEGSIEKQILRSAKNNQGYTTPSEVALESDVSIETARHALDYLVSKGFAEMKVSKTGTIVYHFPDILKPGDEDSYEEI